MRPRPYNGASCPIAYEACSCLESSDLGFDTVLPRDQETACLFTRDDSSSQCCLSVELRVAQQPSRYLHENGDAWSRLYILYLRWIL